MTAPLFAALDCGTNSTRLLIGDGQRTVERLMTITRLGAGVDASGRLAPDAIERVLTCLRGYRDVMDRHAVQGVRLVATSAVRDAANRTDFTDAARAVIGVEPEVLTGTAEGELSFIGATQTMSVDGPVLVVDIGGGSTELAVGRPRGDSGRPTFEGAVSLDVGCVRMTEQHLHHDPPLPEELSNCLAELEVDVDDAVRRLPLIAEAGVLVGLAGTVSAVAAIEQGLATYDRERIHGFELTKRAVEDVFRTMATEALADRVHNPGLERDRADVIVGGCCVLVAVMRGLGFESCLVSESDILDGLVLSQLDAPAGP